MGGCALRIVQLDKIFHCTDLLVGSIASSNDTDYQSGRNISVLFFLFLFW